MRGERGLKTKIIGKAEENEQSRKRINLRKVKDSIMMIVIIVTVVVIMITVIIIIIIVIIISKWIAYR